MLECLIVKNFALIKELHIDFKNNLNVLTGETGSGKSILIGSINMAMGMRVSKDIIREDGEDTVVSISFDVSDKALLEVMKQMDVPISSDGKVIIYRKITKDKNISKINDEPCTLNKIKDITEKLIDIYGQHDGEDLRKNAKHIEFLDSFIGKDVDELKKEINKFYDEYKSAIIKLNAFNLDERLKIREIDILKYEIEELEKANLKNGEEEELAEKFKTINNSKNIVSSLSNAICVLQESNITKALKEVKEALKYDSSLNEIYSSLLDCDSIVCDCIKDLDKKIGMYDVDEQEFNEMEKRLNFIRNILSKYNNSIEYAMKECEAKKIRLAELENYDEAKKAANEKVNICKKQLYEVCEKLSSLRKEKSKDFIDKLVVELKDLGFNDVKFDINIERKNEISRDGFDEVIFMVSLNVGEKLRPLSEVASGGELSRIMLSIKTILSNSFGTETLIFDEIDAGISGITASKVALKLNRIAKNHQVILITHLPQIAAMADNHFVIRKDVENERTITKVEMLDNMGMIYEIGRLIGAGGKLSDSVIANAKELKLLAQKEK